MTSDEFRGTYTLLGVVAEGDVVTHHAVRARTGEAVLVHEVGPSGSAAARQWRERLAALPPSDPLALLATLDVDGRAVLVTRSAVGFHGLADWLTGREKPGEFTLMFGPGSPGRAPTAAPPAAAPPAQLRDWAPDPRAHAAPSTPPTAPWSSPRPAELGPAADRSAPPRVERAPAPDAAAPPPGRLKIRVKRGPADAPAHDGGAGASAPSRVQASPDASSGWPPRPGVPVQPASPSEDAYGRLRESAEPPPAAAAVQPATSVRAWVALALVLVVVVGVAFALYLS